jgi:uncharacterized protein (TIGR00369 family)
MDADQLKAEGWTPVEAGGFSEQLSPFWVRGGNTDPEIGFIVEPRHCNQHMGSLHGGALMTFADLGIGYGASRVLGGSNCSTAQLQIQFVAVAKAGEFVSCKPEVVRQTTRLIFVRGLIRAGDRTIASADGIWKVFEERPR